MIISCKYLRPDDFETSSLCNFAPQPILLLFWQLATVGLDGSDPGPESTMQILTSDVANEAHAHRFFIEVFPERSEVNICTVRCGELQECGSGATVYCN